MEEKLKTNTHICTDVPLLTGPPLASILAPPPSRTPRSKKLPRAAAHLRGVSPN